MGIFAGIGLRSNGVLNTLIIMTSAPVLAFAVELVATEGVRIAWNCATKNNHVWCDFEAPQTDQTDKVQSVTACRQ